MVLAWGLNLIKVLFWSLNVFLDLGELWGGVYGLN